MANTFIQLNDTPSDYTGSALKFVRVTASNSLTFSDADLNTLSDVNASGGYAPLGGEVLQWSSAANEWRPADNDPYSPGNGLSKTAKTLNVVATGGLTANSSGVYIADIANVSGTYGSANSVPVFTVNSKGQITDISNETIVVDSAASLTSNFIGTLAGTAGQISVLNGSGINSNATVNLVATGVTAGTYGNATTTPQITVDSYGRIQNIDLVTTSGGGGSGSGNVDLAFRNIAVAGQTTISADGPEDTLTFVAGSGITLSTSAGTDSLTISANNSAVASTIDLGSLQNVDVASISDGQVIRWVAANSAFEPFTITDQTGIARTDLSAGTGLNYNNSTGEFTLANTAVSAGTYGNSVVVPQITVDAQGRITNISNVSQAPSGVTAGVYGNATLVPQITVDEYGKVTDISTVSSAQYTQTISWNASSNQLSLSGANTVDLSDLNQNIYQSITVDGGNTMSADSDNDSITFVGGTGIDIDIDSGTDTITITNSTASETSGVVAGSYGDTNNIPTFTVDARGRVTSVTEVAVVDQTQSLSFASNTLTISDGNSVDLSSLYNQVDAFRQISVAGQNNIVADQETDTLTFVGGTGIAVDLNSATDTVTIRATGDAAANISGSSIADLADVHNLSGVTNGQALLWNSVNNRFETGDVSASGVDLTAFSVTEVAPSGNGSLSYNNTTGVFTYTPADLSSVQSNYGDANVASYLSAQGYATQSTIVAAITDSAPATLDTLNELAAALGDDPNFATTVTNSLATKANTADLHAVATSGDFDDLTNVPVISLAGSDLTFDGTTLDLSGVGAVGPQGPQGNTGATGNDGVSVTSASLSSDNLILTLSNASTIDAGNVRGQIGPQGVQGVAGNDGSDGADGISVSSAALSGDNLTLTLSNSTVLTAGNVRGPVGPQGIQGIQGDGNAGVSSASVNGSGNLILTLADSTTLDAGNIKGDKGDTGDTGVGITSVQLVSSNLVLNYSNTSTQDVGNIQGPQGVQGIQGDTGPQGPQGIQGPQGNVGIQGPAGNVLVTTANTAPSGASEGQMWYATDDGHTYIYVDGNWVSANPGESPQTLSLVGNVLTISGSNSNVDFSTALAVNTDSQTLSIVGNVISLTGGGSVDLTSALAVNTDAQSLSLGGNVITISGSGSTVDLTSLLGAYVNTDAQTLNLSGNTLTISGSGSSVDLSSFAGGGSSYTDSDVDTHLNTSSATNNQVLSWNGSDYAWVAQSGGGSGTTYTGSTGITVDNTANTIALTNTAVTAGTYGSATRSPRITVDAQGRVTSVTEATISGGGGGGGAAIERFKLNYASNGNLSGTSDLSSGISGVTINSATGGEVTITFDNGTYNLPPGSIMFYGYDYTNNKYSIVPMETSMGYREIAGGGSSGSPTLFNGSNTLEVKLRLREAETGASRGGFGTTTHAWIQFVMYD